MKNWKLNLAIATATLLGAGVSQAAEKGFTAGGDFWGSFNFGLSDSNKGFGVVPNRARFKGNYGFENDWSLHLEYDAITAFPSAATDSTPRSVWLNKGYVEGMVGAGTLGMGLMGGTHYNSLNDAFGTRWINKNASDTYFGGDTGLGLSYDIAAGDAITVGLEVTNNYGSAVGGFTSEALDFGLNVGFKASDAMKFYAAFTFGMEDTNQAVAKNMAWGLGAAMGFGMVDVQAEIASGSQADNDAGMVFGGAANFHFGDAGFYASYHTGNDIGKADAGFESHIVAGVHYNLTKGVNAGLFFDMNDFGDVSENTLLAKVAASF